MLQRGGELDLLAEALAIAAGRQLRGQNLDHDAALERGLLREKDPAHAATAELALDGVGAAEMGLQLLAEVGRHAPPSQEGRRPTLGLRPSSALERELACAQLSVGPGWPLAREEQPMSHRCPSGKHP